MEKNISELNELLTMILDKGVKPYSAAVQGYYLGFIESQMDHTVGCTCNPDINKESDDCMLLTPYDVLMDIHKNIDDATLIFNIEKRERFLRCTNKRCAAFDVLVDPDFEEMNYESPKIKASCPECNQYIKFVKQRLTAKEREYWDRKKKGAL